MKMPAPYPITMLNGINLNDFPMGELQNREIPLVMVGDKVKVKGGSFTAKTVELIEKIVQETLPDTATIAKRLKSQALQETLKNIWEYVHDNFRFRRDAEGREQLRRPIRSVADRNTGIDCDCMVILISSILTNLGISHAYRRAQYAGDADFSHIYVIVPQPHGNHITIDTVMNRFDTEKPFVRKSDHHIRLSGVLDGFFDDLDRIIGDVKESTGFKLISEADKALKKTGVSRGLISLIPEGKFQNTAQTVRQAFTPEGFNSTLPNSFINNQGGNNIPKPSLFDKYKTPILIGGTVVAGTALAIAFSGNNQPKPSKKSQTLNGHKKKKGKGKPYKKVPQVTI